MSFRRNTNVRRNRSLQIESLKNREMLSINPFSPSTNGANETFIVAAAESDEIEYNAHDKAVVQSQGFPLNRFCNFELS